MDEILPVNIAEGWHAIPAFAPVPRDGELPDVWGALLTGRILSTNRHTEILRSLGWTSANDRSSFACCRQQEAGSRHQQDDEEEEDEDEEASAAVASATWG